jgi:signal transduction histidine kinase
MTELLLETGLTSTQRKYAETVQRSGKNLLGIINDLLDFSKIEAGKLELENADMDLRRTIEDTWSCSPSAPTSRAWSSPAASRGARHRVQGRPLRLGQVLTNLVGNAIKFTEQGAVVVRVASVEETEKASRCASRSPTPGRHQRKRSRASSTSSRRPTARPRASTAARASGSRSASSWWR